MRKAIVTKFNTDQQRLSMTINNVSRLETQCFLPTTRYTTIPDQRYGPLYIVFSILGLRDLGQEAVIVSDTRGIGKVHLSSRVVVGRINKRTAIYEIRYCLIIGKRQFELAVSASSFNNQFCAIVFYLQVFLQFPAMQLLYKTTIILFVGVMVYNDTPPKIKVTCDCENCNEKTEKDEEENTTPALYKEDSDGDGNRTICARDRDFNDQTFPSVCHMLCYNRCLILKRSAVKINNTKKYVVNAFRNNYYKLRDGKC
ncbi:uncharacterized protein LOC143144902 [Ptiloglossa arizonensis]|uniref:uncharacterized protein LOC143144902 n=1 Tax=Ptiloglossa arizonensis TaxID=3350558 RepID=UPI003F9FD4F7